MPERKLTLLTRLPWLPARSATLQELWPESCRLISTSQVNRVSFLCWEGWGMSFPFPFLYVCMYVFTSLKTPFMSETSPSLLPSPQLLPFLLPNSRPLQSLLLYTYKCVLHRCTMHVCNLLGLFGFACLPRA